MKKILVLFLLFIVPVVAYLFFASGVNSFSSLPTLHKGIPEFGQWSDLDGNPVRLQGKITVLGFGGSDLIEHRGNLFNLNQKIYNRYHEFKDLQFVYLCPPESKDAAKLITDKFAEVVDMKQWHFVFAPKSEIETFHTSMQVQQPLLPDASSSFVYMLDKQRNLRGRKDEGKTIDGYDTFHPSIISNEMLDDFKVLLYEYKAALRKNHNAEKRPKGL
ncbi:hypothetical protein [Flavobacterium silvaticum]|uniref:Uncharacterized protein n=1 Tax=Flavobacterium silvaticum TaxID=1852020 RepID=A0A972FT80_9FLAO|nr:hypothetical protein [Flavobacterium silvaticum]NMH27110.1 hypothetical protein [Flavobacterium silvaticum]